MKEILGEIWKDVVGYEGIYLVSNKGRVYSIERKTNNGTTVKPRILKQFVDRGYCLVTLSKNRKRRIRSEKVHRLVAMAFIDNPTNKPFVNHINNNGTDNRVENLEWVTNDENMLHAKRLGVFKDKCLRGEECHNSINTKEDIIKIRKEYNEMPKPHPKGFQRMLAKKYKIDYRQIWKIVHGKTWQHLI